MFVGVDRILSELSKKYTVITRFPSWKGAVYEIDPLSNDSQTVNALLTNKFSKSWNIKVPKRGIFGDASMYLQVSLESDEKFEFDFKFSLFRIIDSYNATESEGISIVSITRKIESPKLYHRLLKLECRLTHRIMVAGEEIGYLFKIDDDEYSDAKPFPFCLIKEPDRILGLLPLLIAFCENYSFGAHSGRGGGYIP